MTENKVELGFFDHMRKGQTDSSLENTQSVELGETQDSQDDEVALLAGEQQEPIENTDNVYSDMPHEARRALVTLLRQGVILHSQKAKLFESLCRYHTSVRRHLAEVYLKLVLDEKTGIAFVTIIQNDDSAELDDSDDEAVSLITRRTLSLYDTLMLLVLRKHYQERESTGEQVIVLDTERIESYLVPFLPLTNSSKSDRRKLDHSLNKMVEKKILRKVSGSDGRYEITPVIRYVVNADFLESMLNEYLRLAKENNVELSGISEESYDQTGETYV